MLLLLGTTTVATVTDTLPAASVTFTMIKYTRPLPPPTRSLRKRRLPISMLLASGEKLPSPASVSSSSLPKTSICRVAPGQLSLKLPPDKPTLITSWLVGQSAGVATEIGVTMGASVSFTVTVKLALVLAWLVQVTVVVPRAKKEPDAGKQVIVPQLPVKLGSG